MPGFIRSPKDEKIWQDAKQAANKGHSESEGDSYWKVVNHIYHKMVKTEELGKSIREFLELSKTVSDKDPTSFDDLKSFLEKARKRIGEAEYSPHDDEADPEYSEEQGFREFDPESEDADKWLQENDKPERGEDYEEYQPNEDEDSHQQESETHSTPAVMEDDKEAESSPIAAAADPTAQTSESRFPQPSKEEIAEMRQYTRPWEQRARDKTRLEAEAHKNPVLHHEGRLLEARNIAHKNRQDAYTEFQASPDYQQADPVTQMEMEAKFDQDWHGKNPDYVSNAMKLHGEAHKKGLEAKDVHAAAKEENIKHILSGGAQSDSSMSTEAGLQHAGGTRGEEGTIAPITKDPASSFAAGNKEFLEQYIKDRGSKAKKPKDVSDMSDYDNESRMDVNRVLGNNPALKDPSKKAKVDAFFNKYHPLIGMNAHKVLNKLGLDSKKGDIDLGMLHEAGMHGLFQAINDYDHDHPSKANFSTHASNKIRGLMHTALKSQDQIPQELRTQSKKFYQQKALPVTTPKLDLKSIINKHPPEIADRLNRISTAKTVHAPKPPKNEGEE